MSSEQIHATAVLIGARAVLLRGPSGSGKSQIALALLRRDEPGLPVRLVGDDVISLSAAGGRLLVAGHPRTEGKIEIRGAGIAREPHLASAAAALVVDLGATGERLPEADDSHCTLLGISLPRLALDASLPGAADVILASMREIDAGDFWPLGMDDH